jgi:hypothetical protein
VSGQFHAPAALLAGKEHRSHLVGGRVGSRTCLDAVAKGKNLWPCWKQNLGRPARNGKGKVVPVLYFKLSNTPWRRIGELRYSSTHSLTLTLDGKWSASRPGRFTPRKRAPWYPLDRRLGGLQSRSGRGGEEKNSQPLPGLEPPIIQSADQRYTAELSRNSVTNWTTTAHSIHTHTRVCYRSSPGLFLK